MTNNEPQHNRKREPSAIIDELLAIKGPENKSIAGFLDDIRLNQVVLGDAGQVRFERERPQVEKSLAFLTQCAQDKRAVIANPEPHRDNMIHMLDVLSTVRTKLQATSEGMRALSSLADDPGALALLDVVDIDRLEFGDGEPPLDPSVLLKGVDKERIKLRIPTTPEGILREDTRANSRTEQYTAMLGDAYAKLYELCGSLDIRLPTRFKPTLGGELGL